jgi:multidrug efflux pump
MSVSLVAVFIPLLMMGGVVGRLFREFAVVLSVAIAVSLAVSLTTTPMMCAHMLKERKTHGWLYRLNERCFNRIVSTYGWTLTRVLRHPAITLAVLFATIGLNVYMFIRVPKGFFPQQDNGRMMGAIQADQDTSFQSMQERLHTMMDICRLDPAVANIGGSAGGNFSNGTNTARIFMSLKPLEERKVPIDAVMARLRQKLSVVPGASLYMQASQDLRIGGRGSFSLDPPCAAKIWLTWEDMVRRCCARCASFR